MKAKFSWKKLTCWFLGHEVMHRRVMIGEHHYLWKSICKRCGHKLHETKIMKFNKAK